MREFKADYDTSRSEIEAFLAKIEAEVRDNKARFEKTSYAVAPMRLAQVATAFIRP